MSVTLPYDEAAVAEVAALLGVPVQLEPYRVHGASVYRLEVPSHVLGVPVVLVLWPSLTRVDVRLGDSSIVYRAVATVDLLPGVEVIFRRAAGEGYLFVSVGGRVSVVV